MIIRRRLLGEINDHLRRRLSLTTSRRVQYNSNIEQGTNSSNSSKRIVLGIETSCDDSCASILDSTGRIYSNIVLNQNLIHAKFSGIHPYHAILGHQINLPIAIERAFKEAQIDLQSIDAIAYTRGPGIAGCLAVGATAAKTLASVSGKPLVAVHHMQAHALTPFLIQSQSDLNANANANANQRQHGDLRFPFLSLLVSGGHTLLVLVSSSSSFRILTDTSDLPLGLVIDKISRALGVTWPEGSGSPGSALEKFVKGTVDEEETRKEERRSTTPGLPLALRTGPDTFSFSGLQSATMRRIENLSSLSTSNTTLLLHRKEIATAFFNAAFAQIDMKISHWIKYLFRVEGVRVSALVISGGVASNLILRNKIEKLLKTIDDMNVKLHVPPVSYCTDNAAMVAWTGLDKLSRGKISHLLIPVAAKWSIEMAEDESFGSI